MQNNLLHTGRVDSIQLDHRILRMYRTVRMHRSLALKNLMRRCETRSIIKKSGIGADVVDDLEYLIVVACFQEDGKNEDESKSSTLTGISGLKASDKNGKEAADNMAARYQDLKDTVQQLGLSFDLGVTMNTLIQMITDTVLNAPVSLVFFLVLFFFLLFALQLGSLLVLGLFMYLFEILCFEFYCSGSI